MACYNPLTAYRSNQLTKTGKPAIVFDIKSGGVLSTKFQLPCGQCLGCRIDRSRQWAARCVHEASLYINNCFITLTYSDEVGVPVTKEGLNTLNKRDFVLFLKRLRKVYGNGIRFFHCGEYGDNFERPHHHACLFNHDFHDKVYWKTSGSNRLYISEELKKLWPYGYHLIGSVTPESAAYCAGYIEKKITGIKAADHYQGREPEYITMSNRPGIGDQWLKKYGQDVLRNDILMVRPGFLQRPPKFYDKKFDVSHPEEMATIRKKREDYLSQQPTKHRAELRKSLGYKQYQLQSKKKRGFENGTENLYNL